MRLQQDFLASTGVILEDVDIFVMIGLIESNPVAGTGVLESSQPITEWQLRERINAAARSATDDPRQLQTVQVAGRRVFVNPNAGSDQICLIDEKTILIGTKSQVEEVTENQKKNTGQMVRIDNLP